MNLTSFGGVLGSTSDQTQPSERRNLISESWPKPALAVGMSKSYGDVALISNGLAIRTTGLNKFIDFDPETGILECEPGVLLREIQAIFVKRGWMLAVTPGTSYVTVGGAIANDVHGKDHHFAGTFGDHIISLELATSSGELLTCSDELNSGLFRATIGGLGLTGLITSARIQLKRVAGPYFEAESIPFGNIDEFFSISEETERENWEASVAWFDCSTRWAGRGSFTRGNASMREYDSRKDDAKLNLNARNLNFPVVPPFSLINKVTLDAFNHAYFQLQKAVSGKSQMHYKDFYYPLDGVTNWNRIYGPKGFFQYQSVVPMEAASEATKEMLEEIRRSGEGSFLGVIKTFADKKPAGLLSFAKHGVTLALDFPNRGASTESLFNTLDRIVRDAGGRLNPSKDARMSREMFAQGYPELMKFQKYRDPGFSSDFAKRLID